MDINKNEVFELMVNGYTHEGMGVGRINGIPVFIDGALNGEFVKIKIIKAKKAFLIGKIIEIKEESKNRVKPFCEYYKRCGGCNIQHMNYEEQKKFKHDVVLNNVKKIGKIDNIIINETIGALHDKYYRNKAQYPIGTDGQKIIMGFYEKRTHNIVDTDNCGIQEQGIENVKKIIRKVINHYKVSIYNENTKKGLLRHVVIRKGRNTGEFMVVFVINGNKIDNIENIIRDIHEHVKVDSIVINKNTEPNNVIMGKKDIKYYERESIYDIVGNFKFKISSNSFFQVNTQQAKVLYDKVVEYADLKGNEIVLDLYCGTGTIAVYLSKYAAKVYGIEVVEQAVNDANENLKLNNISNVEFINGKAEDVVDELYNKGVTTDVVVVDPPRQGCDSKLLNAIIEIMPQKIVYVSCNSATLARDLNILCENGFEVCKIQPIDMFPHTSHVETIVLLEKA